MIVFLKEKVMGAGAAVWSWIRPCVRDRRVWAGLALLAVLFGVGVGYIAHSFYSSPKQVIIQAAKSAGYDVSVRNALFDTPVSIEIDDLRIEDFAKIRKIRLRWTWTGIGGPESDLINRLLTFDWRGADAPWRQIEFLSVEGIEVRLGALTKAAKRRESEVQGTGAPALHPFLIKRAEVSDIHVVLDNLGPGIPPIPLSIAQYQTVPYDDIYIGGDSGPGAGLDLIVTEVNNLVITSPLDQVTPVISFDRIRLGISWKGLMENQIDSLSIENPTIYVGPDLFEFTEKVRLANELEPEVTSEPQTPWTITGFEVRGGKMVSTMIDRPGLKLPFIFEAYKPLLVLRDLSQINIPVRFTIPETNETYPDLDLRVEGLQGSFSMNVPPGDVTAKNVAQTVLLDRLVWKGVEMRSVAMGVLFQPESVTGSFTAVSYGGSINASFTFFPDQEQTWTAMVETFGVDIEAITHTLSPDHFIMRGKVNSRMVFRGNGQDATGVGGWIRMDEPGMINLPPAAEVLDRMPANWQPAKRDLARIAIESFQRYSYDTGEMTFRYAPPESYVKVNFDGKQGKRKFDIRWVDQRTNPEKSDKLITYFISK